MISRKWAADRADVYQSKIFYFFSFLSDFLTQSGVSLIKSLKVVHLYLRCER